ncbi:hypothetical protein AB6A40_010478, partial [Gnathostoma spinigerum]
MKPKRFNEEVAKLSAEQRSAIEQLCTAKSAIPQRKTSSKTVTPEHTNSYVVDMKFRFGIIPSVVSSMLNNDIDVPSRINGLQQTKSIIENMKEDEMKKFVPHLHSYFVTLGNVLDDLNFQAIVLCLELISISVQRLGNNVAAHVQQVISITSKHFGNQKVTIKRLIMAICMNLMSNVTPKIVVAYLCEYLEHRSSRVREEITNVITCALLTFGDSK